MAVRIVKTVKLGANAVDKLDAKQMRGTNVNNAFRPYLSIKCVNDSDFRAFSVDSPIGELAKEEVAEEDSGHDDRLRHRHFPGLVADETPLTPKQIIVSRLTNGLLAIIRILR